MTDTFSARPARKRTLEYLQAELAPLGLGSDFVYGLWHRLNGREEEAQSYMDAFFDSQDEMREGMEYQGYIGQDPFQIMDELDELEEDESVGTTDSAQESTVLCTTYAEECKPE